METRKPSTEMLERLIADSPIAQFITNIEGMFIFANRVFLKQIDGDPTVPIDICCKNISDASLHDISAACVKASNATAPTKYTLKLKLNSGVQRDLSITVYPLGGSDDERFFAHLSFDITERHRREHFWQSLASIVEYSNDAIFSEDIDGNITNWNNGAAELYGYTSEEILGTNVSRLIPEDRREEMKLNTENIQRGEQTSYFETVRLKKDGTPIDVSLSISPLYDERGVIAGASAIARDISFHLSLMKELNESKKKYQSVFDNANDYMIILDNHGTVIDINKRFETQLGYQRSDVVGKNLGDLPFMSEKMKKKAVNNFIRRLNGENPPKYELSFNLPNGTEIIGEVNASLFELADGSIVDLVIIRDVTERKLLEIARDRMIDRLTETTSELNIILESIGDGIVTTDVNYKITKVNDAFCRMVERNRSDIIGKPCHKILGCVAETADGSCQIDCGMSLALNRNTTSSSRSQLMTAHNESITIDTTNAPLINAQGNVIGAVKTIRDVSREAAIEKMKNEFISTVSHELRTPLTSILGYTSLILDGDTGDINDTQKEFLSIIEQNSERLTSLVNDLLDIERIESGRAKGVFQETSLTEIITACYKSIEPLAATKNLALEARLEPDVSGVVDERQLSQLVTNLLSNAVKFTPKGTVTITLDKKGDNAEISVIDTGIGISRQDRDKLFSKFFRADNAVTRSVTGTGLGLSIVKAITDLHNGSIVLISAPGEGSTFTVKIPLTHPTNMDKQSPPQTRR